jgi:hypothetical protein
LGFRWGLAVAQFLLAAVSGGIGFWQRHAILNQRFGEGTFWDTTSAYHVWPWPFKFAAVVNLPALIGSMPLSSGIAMLWDGWNEVAENTLALLFVPLLCFWVGGRMEGWSWRRRGMFFAVFFGGSLGWRWRRFSTSGFCPLG